MLITVDCVSIEEDFITWKDKFWPSMCEKFGIAAIGEDIWYVNIYSVIEIVFAVTLVLLGRL